MRLGLLGGTFNPIHFGHLRAAEEIRENLDLDRITFIPSALPPHKEVQPPITAADRLEMVRRAVADHPFFEVSGVEMKRSGISYTIDTLKYFLHNTGAETALFFIVGMDAFLEINTWKSYKDLFRLSHFVVLARPGSPDVLKRFLAEHISADYQYHPESTCYRHPELRAVFFRNVTALDISSTKIRMLVHQGRSIRYLVPGSVEAYIMHQGIYQ